MRKGWFVTVVSTPSQMGSSEACLIKGPQCMTVVEGGGVGGLAVDTFCLANLKH